MGENYLEREGFTEIVPVSEDLSKRYGYDLEARKGGDVFYFEVKGRRDAGDLELTSNETSASKRWKDKYVFAIVDGVKDIWCRFPAQKLRLKSEE